MKVFHLILSLGISLLWVGAHIVGSWPWDFTSALFPMLWFITLGVFSDIQERREEKLQKEMLRLRRYKKI